MSDALLTLRNVLAGLARNPAGLKKRFAKNPERLEKIVLRLVELAHKCPVLRDHILFALQELILPAPPVFDDPRRLLEAVRHCPLTKTAARAMLTLYTDEDIRCSFRDVPYEWLKLEAADGLRQKLMPEADLPSVFAALGASEEPIASALRRMVRIDRNPGGTGRKREREVADTELLLSEDDRLPSERLVTAEDPLQHVCRQETFEQIQRMVTPREWQVTELHLLHGYTFKEIAEMLSITTSSASTMYYRFCAKVGADPNRLKEFFS